MADEEGYRLIPRIKRATLLTLPFVDPEIRNSEIRDYFNMYGTVKNVADEYYRDPEFGNVKTGHRLVFIDLYDGHGVPPFCIVRGQKISVSYRGRIPICFHCNVEVIRRPNVLLRNIRPATTVGLLATNMWSAGSLLL